MVAENRLAAVFAELLIRQCSGDRAADAAIVDRVLRCCRARAPQDPVPVLETLIRELLLHHPSAPSRAVLVCYAEASAELRSADSPAAACSIARKWIGCVLTSTWPDIWSHSESIRALLRSIPPGELRQMTCARLAKLLGYSRTTLWARITDPGGATPHGLLLEERLRRALELLLDPEETRPIREIAAEVGFTDVRHFRKVFRSAFGLTPGAMRHRPLERESAGSGDPPARRAHPR